MLASSCENRNGRHTFIDISKMDVACSAMSTNCGQLVEGEANIGVWTENFGCGKDDRSTGTSCDRQRLRDESTVPPLVKLCETALHDGPVHVCDVPLATPCDDFSLSPRLSLCCRGTEGISQNCIAPATSPGSGHSFDISHEHVPTPATSINSSELHAAISAVADLPRERSGFSGPNSFVICSGTKLTGKITVSQRTDDTDAINTEKPSTDETQRHLLDVGHMVDKDIATLVKHCEQQQRHLVDYIAENRDRPATELDVLTMYVRLITDALEQVKLSPCCLSQSGRDCCELHVTILKLILDIEIPCSSETALLHDGLTVIFSEYLMPIFVFCLVVVMFVCY